MILFSTTDILVNTVLDNDPPLLDGFIGSLFIIRYIKLLFFHWRRELPALLQVQQCRTVSDHHRV